MRPTLRLLVVVVTALTLSVLLTHWEGGGATGRVDFARNMSAPAEGLVASTRGPDNEILVLQVLGVPPAGEDIFVHDTRLPLLRRQGFRRVEIRGCDGHLLWEKGLGLD